MRSKSGPLLACLEPARPHQNLSAERNAVCKHRSQEAAELKDRECHCNAGLFRRTLQMETTPKTVFRKRGSNSVADFHD